MEPAKIVAEVGCNHMGRMDIAKEMIRMASKFCNASAVKFQKRNPRECLSPTEYNTPHPDPYHAYGKTYGEHREFLEFSIDQHGELKEYCEEWEVIYSSSIWDMTSAKEIVSLKPDLIKIPSACNTYFEMLSYISDNFGGEMHISLGMTTHKEEEEIIRFLQKKKREKDSVVYACTSAYPVSFEDAALMEIKRLSDSYVEIV